MCRLLGILLPPEFYLDSFSNFASLRYFVLPKGEGDIVLHFVMRKTQSSGVSKEIMFQRNIWMAWAGAPTNLNHPSGWKTQALPEALAKRFLLPNKVHHQRLYKRQ